MTRNKCRIETLLRGRVGGVQFRIISYYYISGALNGSFRNLIPTMEIVLITELCYI